jgi:p-aminobenzoyl-glutamate transporter AbgT
MGLTNSAESPFCLGAPMAAFIVLLFLVIGAIIGWTIGKIKAKKQQPVQTQPQVQTK